MRDALENTTFCARCEYKARKKRARFRETLVFGGSDLYNLAQPISPSNTF
ncbi:protein of unknown function [Citrobacter amalonaticus]|uniref:Uncharacterized protein n=1 Tax=Citrobacter amalonaticus TaxID=35703 RepID=A0AAX2BIM8_CITAM|nr:protein of unknown function [Citrobacter amalonaticus]SAZ98069.1 protein of unknown function [Citrobacter amalonaticus]